MTAFWYKYIQNIAIHIHTKIILFYLKFKSSCDLFAKFGNLSKKGNKRYGLLLFGRKKTVYTVFSFFNLLCNWVCLSSQPRRIPG